MISARRFVIIIVVFDKLRFRSGQFVRKARFRGISAGFEVCGALGVKFGLKLIAVFFAHCVKIAVGVDTAHIIHGRSERCLNPGIHCRRV